jgi:hypothetical protein
MSSKSDYFLGKTLGEDFVESLKKFELWKPGTKTTVDHEELKTALEIVPRAVMSLLIKELSPMLIGDYKELSLPVDGDATLRVTKNERDVYTGDIITGSKVIVDFKYRAIPGIGLVIMSAFELYDVDRLSENNHAVSDDLDHKIQKLVDERMALHDLVDKVVEKKLLQKEAVQKLILLKLTNAIKEQRAPIEMLKEGIKIPPKLIMNDLDKKEHVKKSKGSDKLKQFIEKRKEKKHKPQEFSIQMMKGETVDCPDCGKKIFDGSLFSGCICLGNDREKKLFIKKTESGINIKFSRNWDKENIEMLLDVMRKKNGQ